MNEIDEKKKENCCGREPDDHAHRHDEREEDEGSPAGRIVRLAAGAILLLGGIAAEKLSFGGWMPLALFGAAYLLTGCDVLFRAVQNLFHGRIFDENFLMTVSTAGAFAIGAAEEAAAVMLFYQIGEFLSDLAVDRARDAVSALLDLRPQEANVVHNGVPVTVSPGEVAVGETILLRPGERIPLDGVVLTGESRIDASGVTGESVPRSVKEGGEVLSGCVNGEGLLTVRVTRAESESAAAKILELTERAAERKAPAERFITKFSRIYTPIVCGIALLVAAVPPLLLHGEWSEWIYRGLTALVISCPCALVISIPLTFFSGIGAASKAGVLLKGSNTLEALAKADVFVFDKTGTVTKGDFEVTKMIPASSGGVSPEEVLSAAACAEAHSSHPIAQSILRAYGKTPETADSCIEHSGCGVEAVVGGSTILCGREGWLRERGIETEPCTDAGTKVWTARDGRFLGSLVIADEIKPGSRAAMESLKKRGAKRIVMLTGDNRETAEAVAAEVGIPEVEASLLPEGKAERLGAILAEKHGGIVFVGDGINDAPVLTAADVGVAMGGLGSDAAMEAADAILMTDELPALAKAMDIARKTVRIGKENIVFAVAVKALCIMLGAAGAVGMGIAVFGDVGVMLLCVANAMRKKA